MANQEQEAGAGKSRSEGRRSERGFAAMDPAQQREIAAEGGRAAHLKGTAHEFTSEEAREAGRKGGEKTALSRARAGAESASHALRDRDGSSESSTEATDARAGKRDH